MKKVIRIVELLACLSFFALIALGSASTGTFDYSCEGIDGEYSGAYDDNEGEEKIPNGRGTFTANDGSVVMTGNFVEGEFRNGKYTEYRSENEYLVFDYDVEWGKTLSERRKLAKHIKNGEDITHIFAYTFIGIKGEYDGEFYTKVGEERIPDGEGTFTSNDGKVVLEGDFAEGEFYSGKYTEYRSESEYLIYDYNVEWGNTLSKRRVLEKHIKDGEDVTYDRYGTIPHSITFNEREYNGSYQGEYKAYPSQDVPDGTGTFTSENADLVMEGVYKTGSFQKGTITYWENSSNKYIYDYDNTRYNKFELITHIKDGVDVTEQDIQQQNTIYVYIPQNGGTKFHTNSGCSGMKNPIRVTLQQAIDAGYTACEKCN